MPELLRSALGSDPNVAGSLGNPSANPPNRPAVKLRICAHCQRKSVEVIIDREQMLRERLAAAS